MVAKIVLMVILTLIISGCKYRRKNTGNSDTGEGECCCKNNAEMAALAGCVCGSGKRSDGMAQMTGGCQHVAVHHANIWCCLICRVREVSQGAVFLPNLKMMCTFCSIDNAKRWRFPPRPVLNITEGEEFPLELVKSEGIKCTGNKGSLNNAMKAQASERIELAVPIGHRCLLKGRWY